jgi:hypothetical protein
MFKLSFFTNRFENPNPSLIPLSEFKASASVKFASIEIPEHLLFIDAIIMLSATLLEQEI